MSELIDRQALRAAHGLGSDCHDCKRDMKSCQYDRDYSLMDFCEWLDDAPTASPWHRVEEPPKEGTWCVIAKHSYLQPHNLFYDIAHYLHGTFSVYDSGVGDWFDGKPLYWMPIEPPKEDA